MDSIQRGALFFQHRIGSLLLIARQSFSILLIGILASGQQVIIQPPALFKRFNELRLLFLCRINPILKVFKHVYGILLKLYKCQGVFAPNPSRPERNAAFIPMSKTQGLSAAAVGKSKIDSWEKRSPSGILRSRAVDCIS